MRALLLTVLLGCVVGCGSGGKGTAPVVTGAAPGAGGGKVADDAYKNPIQIQAPELWRAFNENELKADADYKGKAIEVTAFDDSKIRRDAEGAYLGLVTVSSRALTKTEYDKLSEQKKKWYNEGYPPNVRCYLDPDASAHFAKSEPAGETLVGICEGRKDDDNVYGGYVVILRGCRLKSLRSE